MGNRVVEIKYIIQFNTTLPGLIVYPMSLLGKSCLVPCMAC